MHEVFRWYSFLFDVCPMSLIKYFFLFSELGNYVRIAEVSDIIKCLYKQNCGFATFINDMLSWCVHIKGYQGCEKVFILGLTIELSFVPPYNSLDRMG